MFIITLLSASIIQSCVDKIGGYNFKLLTLQPCYRGGGYTIIGLVGGQSNTSIKKNKKISLEKNRTEG